MNQVIWLLVKPWQEVQLLPLLSTQSVIWNWYPHSVLGVPLLPSKMDFKERATDITLSTALTLTLTLT